jgi:putative transposase
MCRYELREDQLLKITPLLPGKEGDPGRSADNRLFFYAVLWIARSGAPWRDLPDLFGPWNSVFQRFNRWSKKGVWQAVFEQLQDPDFDWVARDGLWLIVRFYELISPLQAKKTFDEARG